VSQRGDGIPHRLVPVSRFERDRSLAGGRDEAIGVQRLRDFVRAAEARESRHGQEDRVELALTPPAQTSVDVAAKIDHGEVRPDLLEESTPAQAGGAHARGRGQGVEARPRRNQGVARVGALQHRDESEAGRQFGRDVLQAVDGQVDLAREQRLFDLLEEGPLARNRRKRAARPVAGGRDVPQGRFVAERLEPRLHVIGLPSREEAAPRSDADSHRGLSPQSHEGHEDAQSQRTFFVLLGALRAFVVKVTGPGACG
jgi:hypothetical protein